MATQSRAPLSARATARELCGQDILLFAPERWDGMWRNRHQIFTRLARHNRVIWIEPREAWPQLWRRVRAGEWRTRGFWRVGASHPMPNLWVVHTPQFAPVIRRGGLGRVPQAIREAPIRSLMRRLGIRRPLLWLFNPTLWDQVGRWSERLSIYHLVDEYTAYTTNPSVRESLVAEERRLLSMADMVLVTSQRLLESKRALHAKVFLVPNGVDYQSFASANPDAAFARLPGPVIGYVGALKAKVDFPLLRKVAEANPDATVLLVGPLPAGDERSEWAQLIARPNVHFTDVRPVSEVPGVIAACDIGLLPYRRSGWTENINSLKLNEYLAVGIPVVAMDLPMVADARDLLHVAKDHDEFVAHVRTARASLGSHDDASARAARRRYAGAQDWEGRVADLGAYVASMLEDAGS
jgi:glycosyltransferase involved in cell wall biosynthesis